MDAELLLWVALFVGGYGAALAWLLVRLLRAPRR